MGIYWEFMYRTGNSPGKSWEYEGNRTGIRIAYFDAKGKVNRSNFLVEFLGKIRFKKKWKSENAQKTKIFGTQKNQRFC